LFLQILAIHFQHLASQQNFYPLQILQQLNYPEFPDNWNIFEYAFCIFCDLLRY